MATADEILATMAEEASETDQMAEVCTIDRCTRAVTIPETLRIVGVETDKDVTRRVFRVLCSYRGTNLSTFRIRIHFRNANKEPDVYYVTDAAQDGEYLTFSWVISRKATKYKGKLQFIACMVCDGGTDEEREWNSTLGEFTVLEGLEVELTEGEEEQARDAITQLLDVIDARESEAVEAVSAQGATQVAAVQAAGAQQEASIAAKGAATLETIPDDYATLHNNVTTFTEEKHYHEAWTKNILYQANMLNGIVVSGDGNFVENAEFSTTQLLAIKPATSYTFSIDGIRNNYYTCAFYTADKAFISRAVYQQTVISPDNAYYCRISLFGADGMEFSKAQFEEGVNSSAYVCPRDLVNYEFVNTFKTLAKAGYHKHTFTKNTGVVSYKLTTNDEIGAYADIRVSEGEKYKVSGCTFNDNYPLVLFFGKSDDGGDAVYVGSDKAGAYESLSITNYEVTIPAGVTRMIVNAYTEDSLEIYKYGVLGVDDPSTAWTGKKIVWFGTSIPQGGNGLYYPNMVGLKTGATVFNEAVGRSSIRCGSHAAVTADDPMGFAGINANALVRSLTLSSAEKQALFDEWDHWKTVIPSASEIDTSYFGTFKRMSYDVKLAKYLTGGSVGRCDLYVIDHGRNDGVAGTAWSDLSDIPDNSEDRTYFIGACNFFIRQILADNPKARICIIGHYENDRCEGITDAQVVLSDIWGFPLYKTWEKLGWSQQTVMVGGVEKTITQVWMPDDLHPHSDTSGEATTFYAQNIAAWFENELR